MATSKDGGNKQNWTNKALRQGRTPGDKDSRRGQSKRTMKYEQSVRDNKSASGKDY